ncbi:hypothetical protein [Methyloceanibacter caenitepidi]|uniref:Phage protein n=1 Tax=Methyloceanibacter caenitepidi TaxID=1384459 RepID=A0A0A8K5X1_9HYPH|nr:hypothetical protein [Methyloceanibacter caenitepidi]BAQ18315.1 phage protein [Methyloceanibacter caenitepidi]
MATFDYAKSEATAQRLIAKFGQAGAIRRVTGSNDPGTPWDPSDDTETTTDYDCTLVVLEYGKMEVDGTLILATDRKVLVSTAGMTVEPLVSDKLVIGSDVYEIVTVKPLNPGGTVLLWEVQARA